MIGISSSNVGYSRSAVDAKIAAIPKVSGVVYTTGNQSISGSKTFLNGLNVSGTEVISSTGVSNVPLIVSGVSGQSAHLFRTINGANGRILTSSRSDGTLAANKLVLFRDSYGSDLDIITMSIKDNNQGLLIYTYGSYYCFSNQTPGKLVSVGGYIGGTGDEGYFALGGTTVTPTTNGDVFLRRDAANIFAQQNGVNSQTFRVYNTYTNTNNFERAKVGWNNNALEIGTEQGSTGGLPRDIKFLTSGVERGYLSADGSLFAVSGVLQAGVGNNNSAPQIRMGGVSSSQYAGFSRGSGGGGNGDILVWNGGVMKTVFSYQGVLISSDNALMFSDGTNPIGINSKNVTLRRDGNGILALRSHTFDTNNTPQQFRIYKDVSATTGQFGLAGWSGDNFVLGAQAFTGGVVWNTIITGNSINLLPKTGIVNVSGQILTNQRPLVNGTGVLLSGEAASLPTTIVYTTGSQTISGNKTFTADLKASSLIIEPGSFRIFDNVFSGDVLSLTEGSSFVLGAGASQIDIYNQTITGFGIYSDNIYQNGNLVITTADTGNFLTTSSNVVYTTGSQNITDLKTFESIRIGNDAGIYLTGGNSQIIFYDSYSPLEALRLEQELFDLKGPGNQIIRVYNGLIAGFSEIYSEYVYGDNLVYLTGNQTITGTKYFNNVYANNLYVNGTETIVNTTSLNVADNFIYLNATGGVRDAGIFINFASDSGSGAYIGWDIPSNSWRFGSGVSETDLGTLDYIASQSWVIGQSYVNTGQTGIFLTAASNVVYTTGNQNISGVKIFNDEVIATGSLTLSGNGALLKEAGTFGVRLVPAYGSSAWRVSLNNVPNNTYCYFGYHGGFRNGFWNNYLGTFGWTADGNAANTPDTLLSRDAAGIIAQQNGVNAQTFRVYNTYSTTGSFERAKLGWNSNVLEIGTEQGSTGGVARNLALVTSGQQRVTVDTIGRVGINTTSPSERLSVNGNILVTEYIINASNLSGLNTNSIGVNAGINATGATYSNFLGNYAGYQATNALKSNFLGGYAGNAAINSSQSNFLGYYAGFGATNANDSNFIGQQAGQNANNANNSNFLGNYAGGFAVSASNSTFIGSLAGYEAVSGNDSNFQGNRAGYQASGANNSNFLGYQAGYQASLARNSNFQGYQAGYQATSGNDSNFQGYRAGYQATSANRSNFLGYQAGYQATNAFESNFFGYYAGLSATTANNSNFLGTFAGWNAVNGNNSNFFGYAAGTAATNAYRSNFLGYYAGYAATNAYNSNFLGFYAGYQAINTINSNFLGSEAGYQASGADNSNFQGFQVGYQATNANSSSFFGYRAGYQAASANNSNFLGQEAGYQASGANRSNFQGYRAGYQAASANQSNFLGYQAGYVATNAYSSNFFGFLAGYNAINANNSIFIGDYAGYSSTNANNSNFLGKQAGRETNVVYSNFLGASAGYLAASASYSNFLGNYAGYSGALASNSNFLGNNAGYLAVYAYYSNFLGYRAGNLASNADNSNFLGQDAGYQATSGNNSNFQGYQAGYQATGANNSNFLGNQAGYQATSSNNSNFLGYRAGYQATSASNSNFVGNTAGQSAPNANRSNFFGQQAGYFATSGNDSNFLGYQAGREAVSANNSNFFGYQAGYQATNAFNCNFLGQYAGYQASGLKQSNFLGNAAGQNATNAEFSNFLGASAGFNSTNAYHSNFFGSNAGRDAATGQYSNFFGFNAGREAVNANNSNFFGWFAGYQASGASNSNFLGNYAGQQATNANRSNFFGLNAGNGARNAADSNFFGNLAGQSAIAAVYSNFLGFQVGYQASGAEISNFLGYQAGYQASGASHSFFAGYRAGYQAPNANNSIFIGRSAGVNDTVNNATNKSSILIGNYTSTSGYSDSIAIGQGVANSATQQLNIGNVLYATNINNATTPTSTPVLGRVGVRVANPQYTLDINGSGNFSSGIYVSGNSTFYNNLSISGHLSATSKAFKINHLSKPGKYLIHGASEAPEWTVFVRGKTDEPIISLPDYWSWLVHENSVTCTITPIGKPMNLYIVEQTNEKIVIGGLEAGGSYNYIVYGERKDIDKLIPEI